MVRKYKTSSWQPGKWDFGDTVIQKAELLYPSSVMKKVITAAKLTTLEPDKKKRIALEKKLQKKIVKLACWAVQWKSLESRPSPAQRKATLAKVATASNKLNELLQSLDGDTEAALRTAIANTSRKPDGLACDYDISSPFYVRNKYQNLLTVISVLVDSSKKAQQKTLKSLDGDRPADVKQWYVEALVHLWLNLGYKKASITWDDYERKSKGAFLEFAVAASAPLGLGPMEAAVRKAIVKGRKAGQ